MCEGRSHTTTGLILRTVFEPFNDRKLQEAERTLNAAGILLAHRNALPAGRMGIPLTFPALSSAFPEVNMGYLMNAWVKMHQDMGVVMAVRPIEEVRRDVCAITALKVA